jgi:hypothetical protein
MPFVLRIENRPAERRPRVETQIVETSGRTARGSFVHGRIIAAREDRRTPAVPIIVQSADPPPR